MISAAALEAIYCLLQNVTYLRTVVSGLVKTSGPIAAVLAVDRTPSPGFLLLLFAWLFFWEIGGQNIPSDWNYSEEDRRANAKTIPIRFGYGTAGVVVIGALILSVGASALLPLISPARLGVMYVAASLLIGYMLLLRPSFRLYRLHGVELAARLFDRASYYPLSQFVLISMFLLADKVLSG